MFDNPFTPLFGGRPGFFFGREGILRRFDRAMGTVNNLAQIPAGDRQPSA